MNFEHLKLPPRVVLEAAIDYVRDFGPRKASTSVDKHVDSLLITDGI
jgi:hypothetical protein